MMKRWARVTPFLVGIVLLAGCGEGQAAEEGTPTRLMATVRRGNLIIRAEATGNVEPVRKVEVKSKASGEVLRLHADVGDRVTRGTLLAEIDPRDVRNNYNQVEANLQVSQARLEIAAAQLERSNQLLAANVITQQEHENARLDNTNAQAELVRSQTNFDLAQLQLNDVSIRAPMDGTIIQKNVEEGVVIQSASQNVSGGTALFLMADLAAMQVRTLVDETDMGMLQANLTAVVSVEAFPNQSFNGVISKIEPQAVVEQNVTMFPVIVSLDNASGLLKPGMNAEVEIFIDEARDVLLVPNNSIVQTDDVGPAAMALGLDVESLDLTAFASSGGGARTFTARAGGGEGAATGGQQSGGGGGNTTGGRAGRGARAGGAQVSPELQARMQELRAQVESGAISQDSMRALMQGLRGQGAGPGVATGAAATPGGAQSARQTRPAAVFVMGADGTPEPRLVQMGLGDWDNTEIVSGVEEGDQLVIVSAAQLQAQQEAFLEQVRGRMGGQNPFGGGVPGGGIPGGRGGGGGGFVIRGGGPGE
ncbi:MAG: efflux RND transporter periplasmic adaptor subunit [Longimicrobiales bacterium]